MELTGLDETEAGDNAEEVAGKTDDGEAQTEESAEADAMKSGRQTLDDRRYLSF